MKLETNKTKKCGNTMLTNLKNNFMDSFIHEINSSFKLFKSEKLFLYFITMQEKNTVKLSSKVF